MHGSYKIIAIPILSVLLLSLYSQISNATSSANSTTSSATTDKVNSTAMIFSIDESPFGISYSEWMGKWWQWHVSLPNIVNEQDPSNLSLIHPREAYSPEKVCLETR